MSKVIHVWAFADAPEHLKALSTNGGDEDWVALVPKDYPYPWIGWLELAPFDSCGDPQRYEIAEGTVYIGSHA